MVQSLLRQLGAELRHRRHRCWLAVTIIPLIMLGAFCICWTNAEMYSLAVANDGTAFLSVHSTTPINNSQAILRVSNDLQELEVLDVDFSGSLACTEQGDRLLVRPYGAVCLLNLQTNVTERIGIVNANGTVFTANDTMLAYYKRDPGRGADIFLMRYADRKLIAAVQFRGNNVRLQGHCKFLAISDDKGRVDLLTADEHGLHEIASLSNVNCFELLQDEVVFVDRNQLLHKVDRTGNIRMLSKLSAPYEDLLWIGDQRFVGVHNGEIFLASTETSARTFVALSESDRYRQPYALAGDRLIVCDENRVSQYDLAGNLLNQRALREGFSRKQMIWLLTLFAAGMAAWMTWFVISGRQSDQWITPWINALVFFGILQLIWRINPYLAEPRNTYIYECRRLANGTWWMLPFIAYFGFYLGARRPAWASVAFWGGVFAPYTLPLALMTGLLRRCGFRLHHATHRIAEGPHPNRAWLRKISIRNVLAITLFVAWSITVFSNEDLLESVAMGLFFLPVLALAVIVSYIKTFAHLMLPVSVFLGSGIAIGLAILTPQYLSRDWYMLSMITSSVFLIANFRCSGYTIQRASSSSSTGLQPAGKSGLATGS